MALSFWFGTHGLLRCVRGFSRGFARGGRPAVRAVVCGQDVCVVECLGLGGVDADGLSACGVVTVWNIGMSEVGLGVQENTLG